MNTIFVLIMFAYGPSAYAGMAVYSQEFNSIEKCQIAAHEFSKIKTNKTLHAICVEK